MRRLLLGKVIITKRALEKIGENLIMDFLYLHQKKNWGDACPQSIIDWNNENVAYKVMSIHRTCLGRKCYIFSDFVKQQTEVFVQEDY